MAIKEFVKRNKLRRLRRILRGQRLLKQADLLWKLNIVNDELAGSKCIIGGNYSARIFGAAAGREELVTRQYLLQRFAGERLIKALLYTQGKAGSLLVYPLPLGLQKIVEEQGFKLAKLRSTFLWYGYMLVYFVFGMLSIFRVIYRGVKESISSSQMELGNFVYLVGLNASNLPQSSGDKGASHEIVSWYRQWPGRYSKLDAICHSVKGIKQSDVQGTALVSLTSGIPPLNQVSSILKFIGWGFFAGGRAAIDLFRGRWWHALMLNQAALGAQVKLVPPHSLAREYLFHNSSAIYRPLWTYEAVQQGSAVTLYFYSTNCEPFERLDGHTPIYFGYKVMSWPRYLVWDEYQADFIRHAVGGNAFVSVVGPIWFSTSEAIIPDLPPKSIAVFDVQSMRDALYKTIGVDFEYYTSKTANRFLSDIYMAIEESGCILTLKRKRNIGKLAHPSYRNFIAKLAMQPNFFAVEADLSAWNLIESSMAVISMPFTSTALLGRELGKPTVYYDPDGLLQKESQPAHGIEILSGPNELRVWLKAVLKANTDVCSK